MTYAYVWFVLASSGHVHARASLAPKVAAVGLASLVASCDAPKGEFSDCLSAEINMRTVKLEMAHSYCSGVIVSPRVIRTAAHCFWRGGELRDVMNRNGDSLPATYTWKYTAESKTDAPDQAEIRADRDIAPVTDLPMTTVVAERAVITAGYPHGGELLRRLMRITDKYEDLPTFKQVTVYALDADNGWVAIAGESGGPVFAAKKCELSLVGTLTSATSRTTYVQETVPFAKSVETVSVRKAKAR